jgi:non-heme chloroperoxidase
MKVKKLFIFLLFIIFGYQAFAQTSEANLPVLEASLPNGIKLHYISAGSGETLIFIHGSISDYTYWNDEVRYFSKYYRVIAYSRRYNNPNNNPAISGYSVITDADDLALLIKKLKLGKVNVVGHSIGAFTALFFTIRHPEMISHLVLAEPPAVSLLNHLTGDNAVQGKLMKKDIDSNMIKPMKKYFKANQPEQGVKVFYNYVFRDSSAWQKLSADDKNETLKDVHEWEVVMPTGTLFPEIDENAIKRIRIPVLILSGDKSYKFLNLIDAELHKIIPHNNQYIFPGAGHQMWYQQTAKCEMLTLNFLKRK